MIDWLKKHWKSLLVGLALVASFLVGLFANSRPRLPVSRPGDRQPAPGLQADDWQDGERVAENIGRIEVQHGGIESDNRRASQENQRSGELNIGIADDNRLASQQIDRKQSDDQRLENLADGLDKIANGI